LRSETIREQLFFSTAFVTSTRQSGVVTRGTSFIYNVRLATGKTTVFLVSNKHVLEDASRLDIQFVAGAGHGAPILGERRTLVMHVDEINAYLEVHSDPAVDVAVLNVTPGLEHMARTKNEFVFMRGFKPDLMFTAPHDLELIDAIEDVAFIGYPAGIYDSSNFLPVARGGRTATPIEANYENRPAFLIDASVFPGSSGSPVFIMDKGFRQDRQGGVKVESRFMVLGVLAAVHTRQVSGQVDRLPTSLVAKFDEPIDLGIVFKAETVDFLIDRFLARMGTSRWSEPHSRPPRAG
jgi:hypothetical protein